MTDRYLVTGLMSGSSLDGVDLACCQFSFQSGHWQYRIVAAETYPYPPFIHRQLMEAMGYRQGRLKQLDAKMGEFFGSLLNRFHLNYSLSPELIASHGHTIFHAPSRGITLQVGNGQVMANSTGITVVNDFRSADVAQGGQGAPLVPVGDRLLFREFGACLNLGGFANISFEAERGVRIAYDIGPCNLALNWCASMMKQPFDHEGSIARSGKVDDQLLTALNLLPYYLHPPPKSLGREWFQSQFLPLLKNTGLPVRDLMSTLVEHLVIQTATAINLSGSRQVLVTGGGAFNLFLIERLQHISKARVVIPDRSLIAYKEALVFALLGLLRIRHEINCLASVTGGRKDLSAGKICLPA